MLVVQVYSSMFLFQYLHTRALNSTMVDLPGSFFYCRVTEIISAFFRILTIVFIGGILSACQTIPDLFRLGGREIQSIETNQFILRPDESVIGRLAAVEIEAGESLPDIARHFGLGYGEITRANTDLSIWAPDDGSRVLLPLQFILPDVPREGIVLNLADMRLFYFPTGEQNSKTVMSYSTGIGREGWSTPLGKTRIIGKREKPKWYVPSSIRREHALKGDPLPAVVLAGSDNPLGKYAMRLSKSDYLIHGTNKPYGVGLRVSHGCVRLYPEAIKDLYKQVAVGTPVRIVDQPYLVGWQKDMLYLAAHQRERKPRRRKQHLTEQVLKKIKRYAREADVVVDWERVTDTLAIAAGIPTPILKESQGGIERSYNTPLVVRPQTLYRIPVVPPLKPGDWSILAGSFLQESNAIKLAAILNHQGPQIPSRVVKRNNNYRVVVGPFRNRNQAKKTSRRMQRELALEAWIRRED